MTEMPRITFCIPSKSNLRYLKGCIDSIRQNAYRKDHEIIVFVDEDTDGTSRWLTENCQDGNLLWIINEDIGKKLQGIGPAYNKCVEIATTDIVMMFHADMVLGKHADYEAWKHLNKNTVVCSTRIEPPLHPRGPEKITEDFGVWPEYFKHQEFNTLVDELLVKNKDATTRGCFAPWMVYKSAIQAIGGHDKIFHSYHEDSDIFNRFVLNGMNLIQSWSSLVYHLTCRGGVFEDGIAKKAERAQLIQQRSAQEFIRKWGQFIQHDEYMYPIITPKYDIGIWVSGPMDNLLIGALEPWCNTIYIDSPEKYISTKQHHTQFNLKQRVKSNAGEYDNDILIVIDPLTFTQAEFNLITAFAGTVDKTIAGGKFSLGSLLVVINAPLKNLVDKNIDCSDSNYKLKFITEDNMTGYIGGI